MRNNSQFVQRHKTEFRLTVSKFILNNQKKKSTSLYTITNNRLQKYKGLPDNSKQTFKKNDINQTTLKIIRSLSSPSNNNKSLKENLRKMDDIIKKNKKNF